MEAGQIVRFHTPMEGEDPNQLYLVLEVHKDGIPRAHVQALGTELSFPPVNVVKLNDLELSGL